MPTVRDLLSEVHCQCTEDKIQNHIQVMDYKSTNICTNTSVFWLTCTTVQGHTWLSFKISSCTARRWPSDASQGNRSRAESLLWENRAGTCYLTEDFFATPNKAFLQVKKSDLPSSLICIAEVTTAYTKTRMKSVLWITSFKKLIKMY